MTKAKIEIKPRVIARGERAMGPGKADLLEHIAETGSISAAAKRMKMSYSRAWQLVDAMNSAFRKPLVEAATGGTRGGGAVVTEQGREVLRLFRAMQSKVESAAEPFRETIEPLLK